jgi:hypothetical protein
MVERPFSSLPRKPVKRNNAKEKLAMAAINRGTPRWGSSLSWLGDPAHQIAAQQDKDPYPILRKRSVQRPKWYD